MTGIAPGYYTLTDWVKTTPQPVGVLLDGAYDRVQSGAWAHGFGGQLDAGMVITTDIHRLTLSVVQGRTADTKIR